MPTFLYMGLQQATTKVFDLWGGSSNNLDPGPNPWSLGFDDSAWPVSANPTVAAVYHVRPTTAIVSMQGVLPTGAQAIAPRVTPADPTESWWWRAHFTLPAAPYQFFVDEEYAAADPVYFGSVGPSLWINGHFITSPRAMPQYLVAGDNLIAGLVNPAPFYLSNWAGTAWGTVRLTFSLPDPSGQVYSWGTITPGVNDKGVLGLGDSGTHLRPTPVLGAPTDVVKVVSNGKTTLMLTSQGDVWSNGDNSTGLLGTQASTDTDEHPTPTRIVFSASNSPQPYDPLEPSLIVDIGIGEDCAVALDSSGFIWSWGPNTHGSFGRSDWPISFTVPQMNSGQPFIGRHVSVGKNFVVVAIEPAPAAFNTAQGRAAGQDTYGQLGIGSSGADQTTWGALSIGNFPNGATAANNELVEISAGDDGTLFRFGNGQVLGCGRAEFGALGAPAYAAGTGANKIVATPLLVRSGANAIRHAGPISVLGTGENAVVFGDGTPYGGAGDADGTVIYGTTGASEGVVQRDFAFDSFFQVGLANISGGSQNTPYSVGASRAVFAAIADKFIFTGNGADIGQSSERLYTWGWGGAGQMGSSVDPTTNRIPVWLNGLTGVVSGTVAEACMFAISTVLTVTRRGRSYGQIVGD